MGYEDYGTTKYDDIVYLYDLLNDLPADLFYQFPQLTEVKRLCEESIEERCLGGNDYEN